MKKIIGIILVFCMCFSLISCGSVSDDGNDVTSNQNSTNTSETKSEVEPEPISQDSAGNWVIYWYLCGSDLESQNGFATTDLFELMEAQLPENVQIVIETGGSTYWHNDFVDAEKLQRWLYDSEGLKLIEEQPLDNMGDPNTLADFLSFAKNNFPAEKTAVLFWNHGGGSVTGAAFDELYDEDSLTLDELYSAFYSVWDLNAENPPIDLIGFDTCLMATIDTAYTFNDIAKYLVASEELEPGNGWYYSAWVQALAENPSMDAAELGKIICDTYYEGCELVGTEQNTTLSVTDLSKVSTLVEAYETFGADALSLVCEDWGFLSKFARSAYSSENYGGNTKEQGYTNMVDLGDLARQSLEYLPSAQAVLDALEDCIVYQINGEYRTQATGLSCYYPYDNDEDDFTGYTNIGAGEAFKHFYTYSLTGTLDETGMDYISGLNIEQLPEIQSLESMNWDGAPLTVDSEGVSALELGSEAQNILAGINFSLFYVNEETDEMLYLGTDNDIIAD